MYHIHIHVHIFIFAILRLFDMRKENHTLFISQIRTRLCQKVAQNFVISKLDSGSVEKT